MITKTKKRQVTDSAETGLASKNAKSEPVARDIELTEYEKQDLALRLEVQAIF